MERINLNNYEAFFLDYMEGNLNAQQEFELIDFLSKHPELKSELDMDLDELQLAPAAVSLDTDFLKREGIQPDEVDGLMAASIEGDLSAAEQTELNQYIYENELESDFKYYQNTFLTPDTSIVFEDKADLKQKDRVLAPIFFQLGSAAILLGGITVGVYNYNGSSSTEVADLNTTQLESDASLPLENHHSVIPNIEEAADLNTEQSGSDVDNETEVNNHFDPSFENESTIITSSFENENGSGELIDTVSQDNHEQISHDPSDNNEAEEIDDSDDDSIEPREPVETIKSKEDYEKEKKKDDILVEEPIKVFTNMAENIFNKEVSYERSTKTSTGEKVEHHVKLGKFEFQRKKH